MDKIAMYKEIIYKEAAVKNRDYEIAKAVLGGLTGSVVGANIGAATGGKDENKQRTNSARGLLAGAAVGAITPSVYGSKAVQNTLSKAHANKQINSLLKEQMGDSYKKKMRQAGKAENEVLKNIRNFKNK